MLRVFFLVFFFFFFSFFLFLFLFFLFSFFVLLGLLTTSYKSVFYDGFCVCRCELLRKGGVMRVVGVFFGHEDGS